MYRQFDVKEQEMMQDDVFAVSKDLMGEIEATIQYGEHIRDSQNRLVKETLTDIRSEEQVHMGELLALLYSLEPELKTQIEKGMTEFADIQKGK